MTTVLDYATKIIKKVTRENLINVFEVGFSWEKSTMLSNDEIVKMVDELESTMKKSRQSLKLVTKGDISSVSRRRQQCYKATMRRIEENEPGEAFHELHDYVYGLGEDLSEKVPNNEMILLKELITEFRRILK